MFEVFSLRLAAGLAAALWALPAGVVEARFYRLHLTIALCLVGAAAAFANSVDRELFWLLMGLTGGGALLAVWSWSVAELAVLRLPTMAALVLGCLAATAALSGAPPFSPSWLAERACDASASLLLGAAVTAMLLGHWYLIAPNLTTAPLLRLHRLLFLALGLRTLTVVVALTAASGGSFAFDRLGWLWLAVRAGAGLFGAGVLCKMSWEAAKIRSTQSATGILYVVVIFVFVGELTDQLLMEHLTRSG